MLKKLKKIQIPIAVLFLFFVSYLLFLGLVLAEGNDDNDTQTLCRPAVGDCDNRQDICTSSAPGFGFDWTPNDYPGSYGNSDCCGDDSQENYVTTDCFDNSVSFCCPDSLPEVQDGECVSECLGCGDNTCPGGGPLGEGWDGDTDSYACHDECGMGYWGLSDGSATGNCWKVGRDDPYLCCGDDSGENYITSDCDGNSVQFCCPDDKLYVQDGECVTECPCGDNSECSEGDFASEDCCGTWGLTTGDAVGICWNNMCCGDDSGEIYETRFVGGGCAGNDCPSFSSDSGDEACCADTNCVKDNNCYDTGQYTLSGENLYCTGGAWFDCDFSTAMCETSCGYGSDAWVASGASGVGEYEFEGDEECCGDDSDEEYLYRKVLGEGNDRPHFNEAPNDNACCQLGTSAVYGGECYVLPGPGWVPQIFNIEGEDVAAYLQAPAEHAWFEPDYGTCPGGVGGIPSDIEDSGCYVCDYLGLNWVAGGESSTFGEYDTGSDSECCEDDSGENHIDSSGYCPGYSGLGKCCADGNDYINVDGNCVSECPTCGDNSFDGTEKDFDQSICYYIDPLQIPDMWDLPGGDSTSGCWDNMCCGDDTDEFPTASATYEAPGTGDNTRACCSENRDTGVAGYCVWDSTCHDWDISTGDGNMITDACLPGERYCGGTDAGLWVSDGDVASELCECITGSSDNWMHGDVGTPFGCGLWNDGTCCCGDDSDENLVTTDCDGNSVSLCCPDSLPAVKDGECVACCLPDNVTGLHEVSTTATSIYWVWNDAAHADYYIVDVDDDGLDAFISVSNEYTAEDLACDTSAFRITVYAHNSCGDSPAAASDAAFTTAVCDAGDTCSAFQCADAGQFYQPRTSITCQADCICPAWDVYGTCEESYANCSVECGDDADCSSGWSCDTTTDVCACVAPNCPMVTIDDVDPADSPTTQTSIRFDFSTTHNPTTIECELDNSDFWEDCSALTKSYSGLSLGSHVFKVRVTKAGCGYAYDNYNWVIEAVADNPPTDFNLLLPTNGQTDVLISQILDWEDSTDPEGLDISYLIYFEACSGCSPSYIDTVTDSNYSPSLDYDTTYTWNIVASDGVNTTSSLNGPFEFTTQSAPGPGTAPTADFSWCKLSDDTVQFTDLSTPGDSAIQTWAWDFDDGICPAAPECNDQHPVHTFSAGGGDWWNDNWDYKKQITFDNSSWSVQTNFPVLIQQNAAHANFWSNVESDASDLRFIDSDNATELYFELEEWDYAGQAMSAWVKVPQIDASASDHIFIYYGNSGASVSSYLSANDVWDADYMMVQHLQETSGTHYDSTSYSNDGTAYEQTVQGTTGKIAGGDSFDGDGDYVQVDDSSSMRTGDEMTLSMWAKKDADNAGALAGKMAVGICSNARVSYSLYASAGVDRVTYRTLDGAAEDWAVNNALPNDSDWHYIVVTYQGTPAGIKEMYVDGQSRGTDTTSNQNDLTMTDQAFLIGAHHTGCPSDQFFNGSLDETRLSNSIRSANWIAFEYCNMMQTCITYGGQETPAGISSFDITLTVTDLESDADDYDETIDLTTGPDCGYDLTAVSASSCNLIGGQWDKMSGLDSEDDYDVYRCQGTSAFCSALGNYSLVSVSESCGSECVFEDTSVSESTEYYYYVSAISGLNNSTDSPLCTGGQQPSGNICPLGDITPACPAEVGGLSIQRHCDYFSISWDDESVYAYRLLKCTGRGVDQCFDSDYFEDNYSLAYEGAETSYDDNEIISVNIVEPNDSSYYCYKVISQLISGGPWSDIPSSDPVCEYSYCYRPTSWQER